MQYEKLQEEIKNAMRAHDKNRLSILRQVHGEVKNIEVNERRDIVEADVDAMLKRVLKQTGETLDELIALIEKTIADLGAETKRDMGKVMGALTAATGGNFDKAAAAKEVGSRLA